MNTTLSDLGGEIGSSLDRSGRGGMLAVLRGVDGTAAAPAFSYVSEPGTGAYRAGASDYRVSIAGVDRLFCGATGVGIGAAPAATAVFSLSTANQPTVDFISTGGGAGNKEGRLTYDSGAAFGAPAWVFQNLSDAGAFVANGLIVFRSGLVALGAQATPLQPASIWTAITPGANWTAGAGLAYCKDACGFVHLKGTATFSTGAATGFATLPAGFRPAVTRAFLGLDLGITATTPVTVNVDATTGLVSIFGVTLVNGHTYSVDGISFMAEQ